MMRIYGHHYHHNNNPWNGAPARDIEIGIMLGLILDKMERLMATLDQVLADVTDESTRLDSLSTLISGLQQQLKDALSGVVLPADVQSKVDAIFAAAETNKAKIDAALNTGVPPVVVPPVTP